MSQGVYKLSDEIIEKMEDYYSDCLIEPPQGSLFRAKTSHATITAYKSRKVLFQGKQPETEINKWMNNQPNSVHTRQDNKNNINTSLPDNLLTGSHIGSDEAGTGDYFGPITTAAVFITNNQMALLRELGVKDSKNLSDNTIKNIASDLFQLDLHYSLLVLRNPKYNQLKSLGWSQGKMKALLHHEAIRNVLNQINTFSYEGILIDQFCEPDTFKKYLASEQEQLHDDTYFLTKAESYSLAVAAASILARARFLEEMANLSAHAGIELPKGASGKVDKAASKIIQLKGQGFLNTCAKTHFANTKKAFNYLS